MVMLPAKYQLVIPFFQPTEDDQHAANLRVLDIWSKNLPVSGSADGWTFDGTNLDTIPAVVNVDENPSQDWNSITGRDFNYQGGRDYNVQAGRTMTFQATDVINVIGTAGVNLFAGGVTVTSINRISPDDEAAAVGPVGAIVGKFPIYTGGGALIGFVPIYDVIT